MILISRVLQCRRAISFPSNAAQQKCLESLDYWQFSSKDSHWRGTVSISRNCHILPCNQDDAFSWLILFFSIYLTLSPSSEKGEGIMKRWTKICKFQKQKKSDSVLSFFIFFFSFLFLICISLQGEQHHSSSKFEVYEKLNPFSPHSVIVSVVNCTATIFSSLYPVGGAWASLSTQNRSCWG